MSDESGNPDVYVRSFPDGGRPWSISRGVGRVPMWSRSGEEIVYGVTGEGFVAATVELSEEVRVSSTRVLLRNIAPFEVSAGGRPSASYDLSLDGERLLLIARPGTGATLAAAEGNVLVLNVFEELRQRTGN